MAVCAGPVRRHRLGRHRRGVNHRDRPGERQGDRAGAGGGERPRGGAVGGAGTPGGRGAARRLGGAAPLVRLGDRGTGAGRAAAPGGRPRAGHAAVRASQTSDRPAVGAGRQRRHLLYLGAHAGATHVRAGGAARVLGDQPVGRRLDLCADRSGAVSPVGVGEPLVFGSHGRPGHAIPGAGGPGVGYCPRELRGRHGRQNAGSRGCRIGALRRRRRCIAHPAAAVGRAVVVVPPARRCPAAVGHGGADRRRRVPRAGGRRHHGRRARCGHPVRVAQLSGAGGWVLFESMPRSLVSMGRIESLLAVEDGADAAAGTWAGATRRSRCPAHTPTGGSTGCPPGRRRSASRA